LWLSKLDAEGQRPFPLRGTNEVPHQFTGFFLDFKSRQKEEGDMFERLNKPAPIKGLVSTISESPPTLNWVYVDRQTFELRYGSRATSENQLMGDWNWTDDEVGVTLEEWEGFVAVEEKKDTWAVYYDRDDDGLKGKIRDKRVLRCSLEREIVEDEDD
jgi:hypothetical protein